MGKQKWTVKPPLHCPQCDSIVWTERHWAASFFAKGRSWICEGCGYELWETVDDQGKRETGERWATCQCCGRILKSGETAMAGYGETCGAGRCKCHERAIVRDHKRALKFQRGAKISNDHQ